MNYSPNSALICSTASSFSQPKKDGVLEAEAFDDGGGAQVEHLRNARCYPGIGVLALVSADCGCPVGIHEYAHRPGHADRIGHLHQTFLRDSRSNEVLGDVSCGVGCRAVDLGRILARERSAAVGSASAVGVHDNLAPGESGVTGGAADHELAGGVHMQDEAVVEEPRRSLGQGGYEARDHDFTNVLLYAGVHPVVGVELVVLGAQDYCVDALGAVYRRELHRELRL